MLLPQEAGSRAGTAADGASPPESSAAAAAATTLIVPRRHPQENARGRGEKESRLCAVMESLRRHG